MKKNFFNTVKQSMSKFFKTNNKSCSYDKKISIEFTHCLDENLQYIKQHIGASDDIYIRHFEISTLPSLRASIVYMETLTDDNILQSSVLNPLINSLAERTNKERAYLHSDPKLLLSKTLSNSKISHEKKLDKSLDSILSGNGLLLIDKYPYAISINTNKGAPKESSEPQTEKVVKGPQQGFVEDIDSNIYMIRKRIKSTNLIIKGMTLGRETKTELRIVYLSNIANLKIVDELFDRLKRLDTDGIVGSTNIEEYINDAPANLFQTTFSTERPDRVQAMLLEGRIAILCDGSPFVIIIPAIVSDFFISIDEYYQNVYFASFSRLIGYLGAIILTFLPAIYVAIVTFHHEVLPTRLALTIAGARAGVPYPAFVEALIMEIAFEALRQAGTRLPTHIGQAVSIVGALIIGQAAVEAGLVSSIVVIVVAATAIFSFTLPYTNFALGLRVSRFLMLTLAAVLGIYGIMTGALILALNLVALRSFGVPFMVPFAPLSFQDMKDWLIRSPQWSITKRSSYIVENNQFKKDSNLKPKPPNNNEGRD